MADKRKKTTMRAIQKELAPIVKNHIFGKDSIDEKDISLVATILLKQYSNVSITQGVYPGKDVKLWLKIVVNSMGHDTEWVLDILR